MCGVRNEGLCLRRFVAVSWPVACGLVLLTVLGAGRAAALTINPDFSGIGTVRVDATGQMVTSGGTDVTEKFKQNINAAIGYWESAIGKTFTVTIKFALADLSGDGAWGNSNATDRLTTVPKHISAADINFDNSSSTKYFIDPTPWDDSEFDLTPGTAALGGGTVNVDRRGGATSTGGASGRVDLLTLALHEIEHSIGFDRDEPIYLAAIDDTGGRHIKIDKTMSGLTSDFDIKLTDPSAHILVESGYTTFVDTVVAKGPGEWGLSTRAKLTGADILAVCQINKCGAGDVTTDPTTIPEPGTCLLVALGAFGLLGLRRGAPTLHR
jgi:hypothetical protein